VIIVLEFCAGGDLFGYIAPPVGRAFPEPLARTFFSQLLEALAHAHTRGVCHRDLKPENLLVGADGALRVSDWCGNAACHRLGSLTGESHSSSSPYVCA